MDFFVKIFVGRYGFYQNWKIPKLGMHKESQSWTTNICQQLFPCKHIHDTSPLIAKTVGSTSIRLRLHFRIGSISYRCRSGGLCYLGPLNPEAKWWIQLYPIHAINLAHDMPINCVCPCVHTMKTNIQNTRVGHLPIHCQKRAFECIDIMHIWIIFLHTKKKHYRNFSHPSNASMLTVKSWWHTISWFVRHWGNHLILVL